jgi:chromosome segregation ATPase
MSWIIDLLKEIPMTAVLKEKITTIEAKNAATETENAILKDDLREAKAEIQKLKNQVEELSHTDDLDQTAITILQLLAEHEQPYAESLEHALQMPLAKIKFYLGQLTDQGYIRSAKPRLTRPTEYHPTQKGLEFLHKNDLVK